MVAEKEDLVEVKNLKMYFPVKKGVVFQKHVADIKAVDDVSFTIKSGCGKTTTGRCILQLNTPTAGSVNFDGHELTTMKPADLRAFRSRMQMIFQDPYSSLDPRQSCGGIVSEPLIVHNMAKSKNEIKNQIEELLSVVGLNPSMAGRFPHEFSGGQRQRIGVARALAVRPDLIVCDEPVSALDVSIQAQVINLLEDLQEQFDLTYLFIAHDLSVVRHISDRIGVMYLGHMVELADRLELYDNPQHPYTKALLSAVPIPDPVAEATRDRIVLEGDVPSPLNPPSGCVFRTRCPDACPDCREGNIEMELIEATPGHFVDQCCINCG